MSVLTLFHILFVVFSLFPFGNSERTEGQTQGLNLTGLNIPWPGSACGQGHRGKVILWGEGFSGGGTAKANDIIRIILIIITVIMKIITITTTLFIIVLFQPGVQQQ